MNIPVIAITALVSTVVSSVVTASIVYFKTLRKKNKALQNGLQSLLRSDIIRKHEKYTEQNFCPIYAKDALRREYEAYHDLGGNGVITDLYNDILALPEAPQNKKTEENKKWKI